MRVLNVHSGQFVVVESEGMLCSNFGTCIGVFIIDRRHVRAGLLHALLPSPEYGSIHHLQPNESWKDANYLSVSFPNMLREFKRRGSHLSDLEAIIVGANYGPNVSQSEVVARANCVEALNLIERWGIPLLKNATLNTSDGHVEFILPQFSILLSPYLQQEVVRPKKSAMISHVIVRKVLVIEDSPPVQKMLSKIINEDSAFEVVAVASDAIAGEELRRRHHPDIITLDLHLPKMHGLDYLKELRKTSQIPVAIISDINEKEVNVYLQALRFGGQIFISKPKLSDLVSKAPELIQALQALNLQANNSGPKKMSLQLQWKKASPPRIILIGSSTGGPEVVRSIISRLPAKHAPIIVAQHMPGQFSIEWCKSLAQEFGPKVCLAQNGMIVEESCVVIGPGGHHVEIKDVKGKLQIILHQDQANQKFWPSVDVLYISAAKSGLASQTMAILLTGMGTDGAEGMKLLRSSGSLCIAQSQETCTVYGMPRAAIEAQAAEFELSPLSISDAIDNIFSKCQQKAS